jgi:hypothetical protein
MRYMTVVVDSDENGLVSVFDSMDSDTVIREYLHHFNVLADETVVLLYQLRGALDHARTIFEENANVLQYDVPEHGNGLVYLTVSSTIHLKHS